LPAAFGNLGNFSTTNASCHVMSADAQTQPNADKPGTKSMNLISLIIEAVSGAVGGNIAGAAMKENSLGAAGNSIAGIVGGGLGGTLLQSVLGGAAADGGSLDMTTMLSNIAAGSVGGAILMAIIGIIKNAMAKK
jgi:hypothetical protein